MKKKICYLVEDGRFSGPVVQIINIFKNLEEYFDQTFIFSSYQSEKTIETRYLYLVVIVDSLFPLTF